jgi:hypothetical protein
MPDTVRRLRRRRVVFALVVVACVAVAAVSVTVSALRGGGSTPGAPRAAAPDDASAPKTSLPNHGVVVFRSLDRGDPANYGHIAWAPLARPEASRTVAGLGCERVHFAAGHGICLVKAGKLGTSTKARLLGPDLRATAEVELNGVASRARVSPDGRLATATSFVSGHSYADVGAFSTRTSIIDLEEEREIADLEDFQITKDGQDFKSVDFNFWGLTFADDSNRFYATLASGGRTYLVEGDVRARTATVLRQNVECPSLSPDNTRIVFKKLMRDPGIWRYHLLDLATMRETALAETRPIDDQAEWLDDNRVLYRTGEETWVVPADGTGAPERFLTQADSPAVVR